MKHAEYAPEGEDAIEARADDAAARDLLSVLHDATTDAAVRAEREVLRACGGGCHMALGAYARMVAGELHLEAVFFDESSGRARRAADQGTDPENLGRQVAAKLHAE